VQNTSSITERMQGISQSTTERIDAESSAEQENQDAMI